MIPAFTTSPPLRRSASSDCLVRETELAHPPRESPVIRGMSGQAMAGLIAYVRQGRFRKSASIIFWHTGGSASLFAYDDVFNEVSGS
jgi:hypothetical protein